MFRCKFRKASHAMAMEPEHWLEAGQQMEKLNHTLLQPDPTNTTDQDTPQLLMISFHVVQRTCSAATFLLIVPVGGKRGIALVDSGSTNTFMDYAFTSKIICIITSTDSRKVFLNETGGRWRIPSYPSCFVKKTFLESKW
jgi:hypothetical protein